MIKKLQVILFFSLYSAICSPAYGGGYLCAVGGGSENYHSWSDIPYRWMVEKAAYGPVLVMHYSEGSAWLENYFRSFGASSAQSLVISTLAAANDSSNYNLICASRLIFLRGGDQSRYYAIWKGSLVDQAIRKVFESGGVIGGTSTGLAILGGVDYTAETPVSVTSADAIANPLSRDITLKDDFLPLVGGVNFDSHFTARARLGRLAAFMANWQQRCGESLIGLGVDENTAACFEPDRTFTVAGAGSVTILHGNAHSKFTCQNTRTLPFSGWSLDMLTAGFGYDNINRQVIQVPAEARAVVPVKLPLPAKHARLLLAGGVALADMRACLQQLATHAGEDSLLFLGGNKAALFGTFLKSSLQFGRFRLVALDAQQIQSAGLAVSILEARAILVAGLTAAEISDLCAAPFSTLTHIPSLTWWLFLNWLTAMAAAEPFSFPCLTRASNIFAIWLTWARDSSAPSSFFQDSGASKSDL